MKAVYPGTFDPVTNGHLDIIERAAVLFDELVVGVYDDPASKTLMFNTRERVDLVRRAVTHLPNVSIRAYRGLTVSLARDVGARFIIRGLRAGHDFEYEFEMHMMNRKQAPDVESIYLMASLEYQFLSSSMLKEVARLGGNIQNLVPAHVAALLQARLLPEREPS